MNKEKISEQSETVEYKGVFKRLAALLPGRTPDTTESLEHEIQELLEGGEEQGLITSLEERMINSIFDFRDTRVGEIMTPAVEIEAADESTSLAELVELFIEKGFTRVPVYRDTLDHIIGILHVKNLLKIFSPASKDVPLSELLNPSYFIDEKKLIVDLLVEFQKRKIHMALVTDEFGSIRGLVTLEDVLEEIVGEIDDEHDVDDHDEIQELGQEAILVQARVDIEEVEERFGVEMPEGPYESVGGLVVHLLGRLAVPGDQVDVGGLRFLVQTASKRHIKVVRITRLTNDEG
ncbi:MAG: hemolysin family protein [Proteobacteria bacterium]|jgi:CBS domain containing-hemolysin-like protein|nr:HlyC/CorC family transporter [Desulfocapsa sp.]MBU3943877.1 hemolysin family protein [Pseudomonadota bacterium]MCG2742960.1 hemolysin family protein [Desulfobacteraceae bacterium]MDO8948651.1 hemolysin family protein [Desulfocapsaceae bacterium]MBU3982026.1 hemolysin family protein [Pseudomonadota bacterium]